MIPATVKEQLEKIERWPQWGNLQIDLTFQDGRAEIMKVTTTATVKLNDKKA